MLREFCIIVSLCTVAAAARPAHGGSLDENPDEIFAGVYQRLGKLAERVARDPSVWPRLEELKREPCDQTSMTDMADALERLGYRREAGQGLYAFVKACGAPVTELSRAGDIFMKLSDYAMAIEIGDEFIRRAPDNSSAHFLRAQGLAAAGEHQRALTDFVNAVELYSGDKRLMASIVYTKMAESYAALGRFCEAASPILTWVAYDPAARDTGRVRKIVSDYEQLGHCATATPFRKERFALGGQRHVVRVRAEVNGVRGTFILDTGAAYLSLKGGFAQRAKIPLARTADIRLSTANGVASGRLTKADKVVLGKLEALNVPTVVQSTNDKSYGSGVDGLLGMSFLSRFDLRMSNGFIEVSTRRPKFGSGVIPRARSP